MQKYPNSQNVLSSAYHDSQQSSLFLQAANPKGEIFIGHRDAKYSVGIADEGHNSKTLCPFILETPGRKFELAADNNDDMERWITALQKVIDTPPTPQDLKSKRLIFVFFVTPFLDWNSTLTNI